MILALSDQQLAGLYSAWSEETYCAGWMADREEEFVEWLLRRGVRPELLVDYEQTTVNKVRLLLAQAADNGEVP